MGKCSFLCIVNDREFLFFILECTVQSCIDSLHCLGKGAKAPLACGVSLECGDVVFSIILIFKRKYMSI